MATNNLENLSRNELKVFIESSVKKVEKEEDLNVDFSTITVVEYFHSDIFQKELRLQKTNKNFYLLTSFVDLLATTGINQNNGIIVFIDSLSQKLTLSKNHKLIDLLVTSFHELCHSHQKQKVKEYKLLYKFCFQIEEFVKIINPNHYSKNWGLYLSELLSDLYGITKTDEILKEYPFFYQNNNKYITQLKDIIELRKINYDFDFIFYEFHKLSSDVENSEIRLPIHDLIYLPNSTKFRDIMTICNFGDNLVDEENKEFIYTLFSTDVFINQLNFDTLSLDELGIMINAVNYCLEREKEKFVYLENYLNNCKFNFQVLDMYLEQGKVFKKIPSKINHLEGILNKLNLYRNYLLSNVQNKPNNTK